MTMTEAMRNLVNAAMEASEAGDLLKFKQLEREILELHKTETDAGQKPAPVLKEGGDHA